jgi:hypothetical protein
LWKIEKTKPHFACAKYAKITRVSDWSNWPKTVQQKSIYSKKVVKKNKHTSKDTNNRDSSSKDLYTMTLELTAQ